MTDLEAWEREAAAFHKATGYLRPGKDSPTGSFHDPTTRLEVWGAWLAGRIFESDKSRTPTPEPVEEVCDHCHGEGFEPDLGDDANPEIPCRECNYDRRYANWYN